MSNILTELVDELEKAVTFVRRGASVNMASIDASVAKLRQHADEQLANLGQTAVTDAEQLGAQAAAAAAPVIETAKQDAEQLASTVIGDVQTDAADVASAVTPTPTPPADASSPAPSSSTSETEGEPTTPAAPTTDTPPSA